MFQPRPKQAEVLAYTAGRMGVSAVPGSGKTHVLSALAARLVAEGNLADDQEVLIVTLVNSAVDNFARRVDEFVQERGLLPNVGYRVRTLHGLAHDIVRDRPALVGLADDFQIMDERDARQILLDAAESWLAGHGDAADSWLDPDLDERKAGWIKREQWPKLVGDIALSFIRMAKDLELTPALLRETLDRLPAERLPLVEMGWAIYADYQRGLAYRGAVDYDDLVRLALLALQLDGEYLKRLRRRWPYILEDEAQDSSRLQEKILRLLTGPEGNWVRVGDPNQAIYETFTTASPLYLRHFLTEEGVVAAELPNSGRSTASIMALANTLVAWTRGSHPVMLLRDALAPTRIEPVPSGDPQPNPPDDPAGIHLSSQKYTPADELEAVIKSLAHGLSAHPDWTFAVLVPRNDRGDAVVAALKAAGLECVELLRSTRATREAAGALGNVVAYLAEPASPKKLATVYEVWRRGDREDPELKERLQVAVRALRRCQKVEDFLWPRAGAESLDAIELPDEALSLLGDQLLQFRDLARRWQGTTILPIDQLILTIAGDLFDRPTDLAVAHKLAVVLRQAADSHPHWRLPELTQELAVIAKNERKFLGFSEQDTGFDPQAHRGKVVVATVHKAKGLEWDRVYLMSVNGYDYPSAFPGDYFIAEKWFVRGRLNLEAEVLAQLKAILSEDIAEAYAPPGVATEQARLDYAAERLRLLYVGITRARRELIVTWNMGRQPGATLQPAAALVALQTWWEEIAKRKT
ncbi:MAG: ATP-dependent helicase [Chloroflexi bacterium]|nr:ATP-dependent helicase [Chloroflexota bacterium]